MTLRPLDGIVVLEIAQYVAGPTAAAYLAYCGARVIKIENPRGGDPLRGWRQVENGTSLWWRGLARNKESVAVDLATPDGRRICAALAEQCDVVIENFLPGAMERWGLGPDDLAPRNPGLVYARISGFGQTGPDADRPGFASVCEAEAGFRHLVGEPGGTPVRPNLSLGDSVAGLHAAFGILAALRHRDRDPDRRGQVVDVAITESMMAMMEGTITEFLHAGAVRGPSGAGIDGAAPSNAYLCRDGRWIVVAANSDRLFARLAQTIGRPEWMTDAGLATNQGRLARREELDAVIAAWIGARDSEEAFAILRNAGVAVGRIQDARGVAADPQVRARRAIETADAEGRTYQLPALAPLLTATPGRSDWAGPALGAHTDAVLKSVLGYSVEAIASLRAAGVIA